MFLKVLLLAFQLATYNIGDTATAKYLRVGIALGVEGPVKVICVDTGTHYNVFVPYQNIRVTGIVNPVGKRLFVAVSPGQPLQTGNWEDEEWSVPDPHLSDKITKLYFYKINPAKSRWYYLVNDVDRGVYYFQLGEKYASSPIDGPFFVISDSTDTAKVLNDLRFDPQYADSVLYIAANTGIYRGYATHRNGFFYDEWTWEKIWENAATAIYVFENGKIVAGTPDGIYYYDGNSWNPTGVTGVYVNKFVYNENQNLLYAATSQGIYKSQDGENWTGPELSDMVINDIAFDGNDLIVATLGNGILRGHDGNYSDFSLGIEDRVIYSEHGGMNVYSVINTNGTLFAGTDIGLFKWTGDKWVNIAGYLPEKTLGLNFSTLAIDSMITLLRNDFEDVYAKVTSTISDSFNVPQSLVFPDFDDDPKINVLLAPIFEYINTESNVIIDYIPVYALFAPSFEFDSTVTLKDYFILNLSKQGYGGPRYIGLDEAQRKVILAYYLSKMAVWQADHNEKLFVITGLSMLLTKWAGFDDAQGLIEGIEYADNFNDPIYQGSKDHPTSVEVREVDRERLFLFFHYLYERYGRDFIYNLATSPRTGFAGLEYLIELEGDSFKYILRDWALTNYYRLYRDTSVNFEIHPKAASGTVLKPTVMPYSVYYFSNEGAPMSFNAVDNYSFNIYELSQDTVLATPVNLDEYGRFFVNDTMKHVWLIVNSGTGNYKITFAQDVVAPESIKVYTMQNTIFDPDVDFYIVGSEALYSDVDVPPAIVVKSIEDTSEVYSFVTSEYGNDGTNYIYEVHTQLNITGELLISTFVQDIVGNQSIAALDTIGIFRASSSGSLFGYLGNELKVRAQEGTLPPNAYVLISRLPVKNYKLDGLVAAYEIGKNIPLAREAEIEFNLPFGDTRSRFEVLHYENGNIQKLQSSSVNGHILVHIRKLGIFLIRTTDASNIPVEFELKLISGNVLKRTQNLAVELAVPQTRGNASLVIYNVAGQRVYEKVISGNGYRKISVPLRSLGSGVYFVGISVDGKLVKSQRFILY